MKRFIIISLLAAMVLPSLACAGGGTDNYYPINIQIVTDNTITFLDNDGINGYLTITQIA